jgi:hypothetical protein
MMGVILLGFISYLQHLHALFFTVVSGKGTGRSGLHSLATLHTPPQLFPTTRSEALASENS